MRQVENGIYLNYRQEDDSARFHKIMNIIRDGEARDDKRLSTEPPTALSVAVRAKIEAGVAEDMDVHPSLYTRLSRMRGSGLDDEVFIPADEVRTLVDMAEMNVQANPEFQSRITYSVDFQRQLGDFLASKSVTVT